MKPSLFGVLALGYLAGGVGSATAQDTSICEIMDQGEIVAIALCSESELTEAQLRVEGERICGDTRPCGVWFWSDAEDMPASAPVNHDGLTSDEVASSHGVWVAETQAFINIERASD